MIRRILVTLIPSCFIAASVAADPDATSAAPVADNGGLQEIVVTARRRAEDLQSVPLTVTAITAAMIETQDVTNIEDLNSFVPNMKIAQDRATSSTINVYIRGVGQSDPLWGFDPGVGVYIDDVYLARPQAALLDVLDVARLEADANVPIRRTGNDHFADQEEMVQGIEGVNRSRAAHRDDSSAHLAAEDAAVSLGNQTGAVHQCFDFWRDVGYISR